MDDLFEKYLIETTWTGMGDEAGNSYLDDGSGIAGDDDRPPGNILIGSRYEKRGYFNKLNHYNNIWDVDNKEDFKWDWFENATGQDDFDNYSNTLQSMDKLFPEDTWNNAWKKMKNVPDREADVRFDIKGQPYRDSDDTLGDEEEDTVDVPKELDVKESNNLMDRIDKILIDVCKSKKNNLTESNVAKTILKQINAIDKWALDSYGAKNFVQDKDSIQFDVRGSKFRGRVRISYDKRNDTYVVELGNVRKLEWKQKYMMKNVFAGDLVNVLDQQVG